MTTITFHQALFGYDSGHHLLAASLNLSAELKHFLAVATDLSGSAPPTGFEASYTGMPLVGTKYYVLFCTWQASEMPRPGSVWSHVLFMELGDVAQIPDLYCLKRLFRRPTTKTYNLYRTVVTDVLQTTSEPRVPQHMMFQAANVLHALYQSPDASIVVLSPWAEDAEYLAFSIWSQQWPKLRRNFRFSTGSFADRGKPKSQFDLQIAPSSSRRLWQREGEHSLIDFTNESSKFEVKSVDSDWLPLVVSDLFLPQKADLRRFLSTYGSDVREPRPSFAKLAQVYQLLSSDIKSDHKHILEVVGTLFPEADDAAGLKSWVCEPANSADSKDQIEDALATASFLLTSPLASSFANQSVDLSGLATMLWKARKNEVLDLLAYLVRQSENPMASSFAKFIAEAAQPRDLQTIVRQRPELLPLILGQNPRLAFNEDLWRSPAEIQWRAYEVLDGSSLPASDWGQLISNMRPATTAIGARNLVRKGGIFAIEGVFEWASKEPSDDWIPTEQWRDALSEYAANLLRTQRSLTGVQLALCAWLVTPEIVHAVLDSSREDVQELASQPLESLPSWLRSHTAFLLATLGLTATDESGVACLTRSFFEVHRELASGHYSGESWLLLAPCLPELGLWKEWDRCKRLRKAVKRLPTKYANRVAASLLNSAKSEEEAEVARKLLP